MGGTYLLKESMLTYCVGTDPVNSFSSRIKYSRLLRPPKLDGNVPLNWLETMLKISNSVKFPISVGIDPPIEFWSRLKIVSFEN